MHGFGAGAARSLGYLAGAFTLALLRSASRVKNKLVIIYTSVTSYFRHIVNTLKRTDGSETLI